MEYKGKLYGKIGKKYFDTGKTTDDWDRLDSNIIHRCECECPSDQEIKICTNCSGYVE